MKPAKLDPNDGKWYCELEPGVDTKQAGDQFWSETWQRWEEIPANGHGLPLSPIMRYRRPVPAEPRAGSSGAEECPELGCEGGPKHSPHCPEHQPAPVSGAGHWWSSFAPKPEASPCRACAAKDGALDKVLSAHDQPAKDDALHYVRAALKLSCDCQQFPLDSNDDSLINVRRLRKHIAQLETDLAEDHCRRADTAEHAVATNCRRIAELEAQLTGERRQVELQLRDIDDLQRENAQLHARPQSAWISLSERLPTAEDADETGIVVAKCEHLAKTTGVMLWHQTKVQSCNAEYWLPLPKLVEALVEARNPDEEEFEKAFGNIFQPFAGVTTISDEQRNEWCRFYAKAVWDAARKEKPCS